MAQLEEKLEPSFRTTRGSLLAGSPSRTGPRRRSRGGDRHQGSTTRSFRGGGWEAPGWPCTSRWLFPYSPTQSFLRCWSLCSSRDLRLCLQQRLCFSPLWNEKWQLLSLTLEENKQKLRPAGRDEKPLFRWSTPTAVLTTLHALGREKIQVGCAHADGWERR